MTNLMLGEKLPDELEINGIVFPIRTDFRAGIRFSAAARDKNLTPDEVLDIGFVNFFGREYVPLLHTLGEKAADAMLYYYSRGKKHEDGKGQGGQNIRVYDFNQDADYIYSEFLITAGIDLETASLHWWKFMALFERLCTNTPYSKIIEYRAADVREMPKETAKFYRKMKQLYAIERVEKRVITKAERDEMLRKRAEEIFKRVQARQ